MPPDTIRGHCLSPFGSVSTMRVPAVTLKIPERCGVGLKVCQSAEQRTQAAEKVLKAVLVFLQIDFPRYHDLDALRNLIPVSWPLKEEHADLSELTEWAVEARYPGDWPDATEEDARSAVQQARAVWQSVCRDLASHGFTFEDVICPSQATHGSSAPARAREIKSAIC
jgi:HEPN domain-containing protein